MYHYLVPQKGVELIHFSLPKLRFGKRDSADCYQRKKCSAEDAEQVQSQPAAVSDILYFIYMVISYINLNLTYFFFLNFTFLSLLHSNLFKGFLGWFQLLKYGWKARYATLINNSGSVAAWKK